MKIAIPALALLFLVAGVSACGGETEVVGPKTKDDPIAPKPEQPKTDSDRPSPPSKDDHRLPGDTAGGAVFLSPGSGAPADHKPISAEDRAELAEVYISFAEDPEGFIGRVQKVAPDRRERIAGYLLCAANKLQAAGRQDQVGAPVQIEIPVEAKELIRYEGAPDKARSMFLRQLGGEFLVVGRSIQSIAEGDTRTVEQILARQKQNLEMMKIASGPDKAEEWSATLRRVFPILFARLIPEC
jgi:hypothetical protein